MTPLALGLPSSPRRRDEKVEKLKGRSAGGD
jgi:hypothetical protein